MLKGSESSEPSLIDQNIVHQESISPLLTEATESRNGNEEMNPYFAKPKIIEYEWTIKNFAKLQYAKDDQLLSVIHSETFSWSKTAELQFSLRLFPKFTEEEDFVSIFLYLEEGTSECLKNNAILYSIMILNSNREACFPKGI